MVKATKGVNVKADKSVEQKVRKDNKNEYFDKLLEEYNKIHNKAKSKLEKIKKKYEEKYENTRLCMNDFVTNVVDNTETIKEMDIQISSLKKNKKELTKVNKLIREKYDKKNIKLNNYKGCVSQTENEIVKLIDSYESEIIKLRNNINEKQQTNSTQQQITKYFR